MRKTLLTQLEEFAAETGLGEHRVGILVARNGRIFDRIRAGGRIWPETEARIRLNLEIERKKRAIKAGAE